MGVLDSEASISMSIWQIKMCWCSDHALERVPTRFDAAHYIGSFYPIVYGWNRPWFEQLWHLPGSQVANHVRELDGVLLGHLMLSYRHPGTRGRQSLYSPSPELPWSLPRPAIGQPVGQPVGQPWRLLEVIPGLLLLDADDEQLSWELLNLFGTMNLNT